MEEPGDAVRGALSRRRFLELVGLGTAGVALGACSSGASSSGSTVPTSTASGGGFPLDAAKKAKGVTTITMWHSMTANNLVTLQSLVKTFNSSQSKIEVRLLAQADYTDTFTAYRTALGTKNLPDLVQMETINLQAMIDSRSIVPVEEAMAADSSFDRADVLASAMAYFTVGGVQYAMPWNCSAQIMYYDKRLFARAGLNPDTPPTTFQEYRDMSAALKTKAGLPYGTAIKLTASNFEDWIAKTGGLLLNHENGRQQRATAVAFDTPTGRQIMSFLAEMFHTKLAEATLATNFDNLLAIANGSVGMTIETSAALGTVLKILGGGQYHNVTLGVGPLPGLDGLGEGVPYGGAGLYIVKASSPERQDAAWQFTKFLLSPSAMAVWAIGSGYIPITRSSAKTAAIQHAWSATPQYKVAYEAIANSATNPATAGAVAGPLSQIETYLGDVLSQLSNGGSVRAALASAATSSNQVISSYNSSVS